MASGLWVIGVSLSLAATLFGTLGKVLLKLAHTSTQAYSVQLAATACVFLLNPVFDAVSYAYAAQSILAPMAGFSVVWNIVLAPYILEEQVSIHDIRGSAVILMGCVMVGVSGSHDTPKHSSADIFALFTSNIFIAYAACAIVTAGVLVWMICNFDKKSGWRRFAFGALSGLVGGNLFFLKASVELLGEGGAVWMQPETYLIFVAALSSAGGGIYILDAGLREYDALYLVAIYQACLIVIGSISGVIFFHENTGMNTWWQSVLYPVSIVTTVGGIIVLSDKHTEHADSKLNSRVNVNGVSKHEQSPLIDVHKPSRNGAIDVVV